MDPHSFIARAEAQRWIGIAEKLLMGDDLVGAKTFAIRARDSDPRLEAADQILAIADTLLAAEKRVVGNSGNQQPDFYAILQLVRFVQDTEHIAAQYRRLAVTLNPHQNRFPYSDQAFQLVNDAWAVLSNPMRKSMYDAELDLQPQQQMNTIGFNLEQHHNHHHRQQQQQHNFFSINHMGSSHEQEMSEPPEMFQTRVQQQQLQQHNFLSQPNPIRPAPVREQEQLFQQREQEQLFQQQVQPFHITSTPQQQNRPQPSQPQSPMHLPTPPAPAASPQPPFSWPQAPSLSQSQKQAKQQQLEEKQRQQQIEEKQRQQQLEERQRQQQLLEERQRQQQLEERQRQQQLLEERQRQQWQLEEKQRLQRQLEEKQRQQQLQQQQLEERQRQQQLEERQRQQQLEERQRQLQLEEKQRQLEEKQRQQRQLEEKQRQQQLQQQQLEEKRRQQQLQQQQLEEKRHQQQLQQQWQLEEKQRQQRQLEEKQRQQQVEEKQRQQLEEKQREEKQRRIQFEENRHQQQQLEEKLRQQQKQSLEQIASPVQPSNLVNSNNGAKEEETKVKPGAAAENVNKSPTFWTACPYDFYLYEYPGVYADCTLRCENCKRAFQAVPIPSPPPVIEGPKAYGTCWGFFPLGGSASHTEKINGTGTNPNLTPISPVNEAADNAPDNLNSGAALKKNSPVNEAANNAPEHLNSGAALKQSLPVNEAADNASRAALKQTAPVNEAADNASGAALKQTSPVNEAADNASGAALKKTSTVNKTLEPRIYIDDVTDDVFMEISEPSDDSDVEWGSAKKKKAKRMKKSSSHKKKAQFPATKARNTRNGRGKNLQDATPDQKSVEAPTVPVAESSKKAMVNNNPRRQSVRVKKELGKLDLNVEFNNNEGEEPAAGTTAGNRGHGQGEEDNIEGIGFFEGLDEFLSSLPILSVVNDVKVKAA